MRPSVTLWHALGQAEWVSFLRTTYIGQQEKPFSHVAVDFAGFVGVARLSKL
jgi:hypothetical protein